MKFTKIIQLSRSTAEDIASGKLKVQPGQWFRRQDGTLAQLVAVKKLASGGHSVALSDAGKGDGFKGRTQRFARARWHTEHRHQGLAQLVRRAPVSVSDAQLGQFARQMVA
jgi:hypothetical protein